MRKTSDVIEAKGVELTQELASSADMVLYLVDSSKGITDEDKDFLAKNKTIPQILVLNKTDLAQNNIEESVPETMQEFTVKISAKKSEGIGALTALVKKIILKDTAQGIEKTGLGSQRQKECVIQALERVEHALEIARDETYGLDAVVQDLEDSLDSLGEVTGEVTPDDVLGSIFAHFCVGK